MCKLFSNFNDNLLFNIFKFPNVTLIGKKTNYFNKY